MTVTLEQIQQAIAETGNIAAAARKLNVRWHTVRDRLAKASIEVPKGKGGARPTCSDEQLIYLYRMTGSISDLSFITQLHASGIRRRLLRMGIRPGF
jgi:hypothetical protein